MPSNWSIVRHAVWHVAPSCWNHMSCKSSSFILDKKKLDIISRQRSPFTVMLRFAASLKKYDPMMPPAYKPHQTVTFPECLDSFCNSSGWSSLQNRQFCYLRTHLAKNELRRWTQFFVKKVDLRPTFQEPIHQKLCVAVGCLASILAPALFWKASHLNSFCKIIHVVE